MVPTSADAELAAVERLELSLLDPEVRADRARVEALLADDATEVGTPGTAEQLAALTGIGCRYGQGYLLARPMTAEAMCAHLAAGRRAPLRPAGQHALEATVPA